MPSILGPQPTNFAIGRLICSYAGVGATRLLGGVRSCAQVCLHMCTLQCTRTRMWVESEDEAELFGDIAVKRCNSISRDCAGFWVAKLSSR